MAKITAIKDPKVIGDIFFNNPKNKINSIPINVRSMKNFPNL